MSVCEPDIVRPDDVSRVKTPFFHSNPTVSLGRLAVAMVDLLFW